MSVLKVAIFSNNTGWHEERLLRALATRGVTAQVVSVADCRIATDDSDHGLVIPGYEQELPDAALVRAIPDGPFEAVTFRLDILHALGELGVEVYNSARAIERTVDKAMTSLLLSRSNIASPPVWVCESVESARAVVAREAARGGRVVLKPLFGNCGRGLMLLERPEQLPAPEPVEGVYYLQQFVDQGKRNGRDWRIFVIGDRAVAAMERVSEHWITNRARGGQCLPAVLTDELRDLAERAAVATGTAYAGVDIIRDPAGNYLVLEVNSVPAWRGLQSVFQTDIAELLAEDLLRRLLPKQRPSVVV